MDGAVHQQWTVLMPALSYGQNQSTLEQEMAAHSSILAWRIPGTEKPGGLQSKGLQRLRPDGWTEHPSRTAHT